MKGDLSVIGPQFHRRRDVAASATRFEVGEPLISTATLTAGVASANTFALAAADFVINGTNWLGGIVMKLAAPYKTGTLTAQSCMAACPIPYAGVIRGKAETAASVDTASELLGVIGDVTRVDYNATGGSDGGELYTVKEAAAQDTDLFAIVDGNFAKSLLDISVDPLAYRIDNDYT